MSVNQVGRVSQLQVRGAGLDADQIASLLPHRQPFLLLDRVIELDPPDRAVGLKNVTVAEPWSAGHFPGRAVLPGVLAVECLAQLAGVLISAECAMSQESTGAQDSDGGETPDLGGGGVLAEIKRFRFRQPIVPGDQMRLQVERTAKVGRVREFDCVVSVGTARAAHGGLVIVV